MAAITQVPYYGAVSATEANNIFDLGAVPTNFTLINRDGAAEIWMVANTSTATLGYTVDTVNFRGLLNGATPVPGVYLAPAAIGAFSFPLFWTERLGVGPTAVLHLFSTGTPKFGISF